MMELEPELAQGPVSGLLLGLLLALALVLPLLVKESVLALVCSRHRRHKRPKQLQKSLELGYEYFASFAHNN